jgi:hypothetical protein
VRKWERVRVRGRENRDRPWRTCATRRNLSSTMPMSQRAEAKTCDTRDMQKTKQEEQQENNMRHMSQTHDYISSRAGSVKFSKIFVLADHYFMHTQAALSDTTCSRALEKLAGEGHPIAFGMRRVALDDIAALDQHYIPPCFVSIFRHKMQRCACVGRSSERPLPSGRFLIYPPEGA